MGLESADDFTELNPAWPLGSDPKSQGDDHLRLIKGAMQGSNAEQVDMDVEADNRWISPALGLVQARVTKQLEVGYTLDEAPVVEAESFTPDFKLKALQRWQPAGDAVLGEPTDIGAADYLVEPSAAAVVTLESADMRYVAGSETELAAGEEYLMRVTRWHAGRTTVAIVPLEAD